MKKPAPGKKPAPAKKPAPGKKPAPAKKAPSARESGKTVDAYVAGLSGWQKEAVSLLREIVRRASPEATESIKWGQPVYELRGPFAHTVHLGVWRGAELEDPSKLLTGEGARMRHVSLSSLDEVSEVPLAALVREAIALNRAKGDPTKGG
jgi:hypothetical protein